MTVKVAVKRGRREKKGLVPDRCPICGGKKDERAYVCLSCYKERLAPEYGSTGEKERRLREENQKIFSAREREDYCPSCGICLLSAVMMDTRVGEGVCCADCEERYPLLKTMTRREVKRWIRGNWGNRK